MFALVDDGHQAIVHRRQAFRIAPADQGHFAQHIALQGQFDEKRVLAHDGEQGFGLRVIGQVGRFVLLHAWQQFGVDHCGVIRQPDTFLALGGTFETLLQPERTAIIPMHGNGQAIGDDGNQQQPVVPAHEKTRAAGRF